ncbi:MAG: carbohydrate kinase [Oscillatoriales cyanobacterium SM2_1_8]|nr:carbohydrate kinase [Oscillatoriales cyanobacterium SM2_1_8]
MARVLCLGEVLRDRFVMGDREVTAPGGAVANVAIALAKLGVTVEFIGCVGEDPSGRELRQGLQAAGVGIVGLQRHPQAPTREIRIRVDAAGERSFLGFSGAPDAVYADGLVAAELLPEALFEAAEFLVLGSCLLPSPIAQRTTQRALHLANKHYLKVVTDINWRSVFWPQPHLAIAAVGALLQQTDFLKVSYEEALHFLGTASPAAIANQWPDLEGVLVTDGERGGRYFLGDRQGEYPAYAVATVDTTGAGDAFLAGFLAQLTQIPLSALAQPKAVQTALAYAAAVGALATRALGATAALPTAAETTAFLQNLA